MAAHKRFARAVKKRDRYRCRRCGATQDLRAAHVVPLAQGGGNEISNGITLCGPCDRSSDSYAR